jgi:hypothetical protein
MIAKMKLISVAMLGVIFTMILLAGLSAHAETASQMVKFTH